MFRRRSSRPVRAMPVPSKRGGRTIGLGRGPPRLALEWQSAHCRSRGRGSAPPTQVGLRVVARPQWRSSSRGPV
eukprot:11205274-Lingulodinium_polyedra.AAC.1